MAVGRTKEQTLRAVMLAHLDRLNARGASSAERNFFSAQIGEIVGRFDLISREIHGFPTERIDVRILENLAPLQQALIHYLVGQKYMLTNGITVPYAAAEDSGKEWMTTYLHEQHPMSLAQLTGAELRKRELQATRLMERGSFFQELLGYRCDGYCEDRREAMERGKPFTEKTEQQLGEELIAQAEQEAREWRTVIANPETHYADIAHIIHPLASEEGSGEDAQRRLCERVQVLHAADPWDPHRRSPFGSAQQIPLVVIADTYRLMPEERLTMIAQMI